MFNTVRLILGSVVWLLLHHLCSPFTTVAHLLMCNIEEKKLEQKGRQLQPPVPKIYSFADALRQKLSHFGFPEKEEYKMAR